ncbi:MAG: PilZ domain-containing protein [Desulfovibrionaceae bacterium]|nr:PilZ domain-containing protein [Desulfovibrionaceae bacterium]
MSNEDENGSDSRDYSRISCFLKAIYRKMSHPEEPQLCPSSGISVEDKNFRDRFAANPSNMAESVVSFLLNLDSKLDRIIAQINKDTLTTYFNRQMVVLDLSASGLLVHATDLQAGDDLEMVLFLGELPPIMVSGVLTVLRQGKPLPGVGPTFALRFTRLRESEREQIVRFVFKENRERVRTEKLR